MRSRIAACILFTLISACAADQPMAPSPSPTPEPVSSPASSIATTPVHSPSPSELQTFPEPPPNETEEEAAIREGLESYWAAKDLVAKNPQSTDFTEAVNTTVPGSAERRVFLSVVTYAKDENIRLLQGPIMRELKIGPTSIVDGKSTVVVTYCADTTTVQWVDVDTDQVRLDISPSATLFESTTLNEITPGTWKVAEVRNEARPC